MRDQAIAFGRYRLDPRGGLSLGAREIRLTPKALAVLCVLAHRPGHVVTKEELFAAVWTDTAVSDAALVTCIQELRRALRDDARRPRYIETLHRRGYRFIARPARDRHVAPERKARLLVGRDRELSLLDAALERARGGERQIVLVRGEAGIGKTSLVETFVARAEAAGDVQVAWGQSAEHYGASEPYLPLLEALARWARGPAGPRVVAAVRQHAPTWALEMPSLLGDRPRRDLGRRAAGVTRERMLRELTDVLEAAAEPIPTIVWLEDLHWSDVSTIDWLASFARRPEPARVLVIGTYRTAEAFASGHPLRGMQDELARHGRCREIALAALGPSAVGEYLACRFAGLGGLAAEVHRRTEGSPLFMVGVLDDLVDRGVVAQVGGRWTVRDGATIGALGIPEDLRRLIERQLDRLDDAECRLLEVASVHGADFSAAAAAAGAEVTETEAERRCADLARRQHLIRDAGSEEWPDGTVASRFDFQHALYREALYERIPAGRRAELHRRVGRRLEQAFAGRVHETAGELAMHFERGRDIPRAVQYLHAAGTVAGQRGAAAEAVAYFTRAVNLIEASPPGPARDQVEAHVRLGLCVPLIALHGYGSEVVETAACRANTLCDRLGDPHGRFAASRVVWNASLMRHPVPRTLAHARELMSVAIAANEPARLALAHRALGTSLKLAGELEEAVTLLGAGARLADTVPDDAFADYGEHPGMICRAFAAWAQSLMGRLDDAARLAEEAIEHARQRRHPHGLAFALVSSGLVYVFQRGVARAAEIGAEVIGLAREHRLPQWLAFGQEITGWAMVREGRRDEGIRLQEDGLRELVTTGARTHLSRMLANLAESYLVGGERDMARRHLAAAHAHRERHGEHYYAAELHRLDASLIELEGGPREDVEKTLAEAIDLASGQRATLLALRAATDLAGLKAAHGDRPGARAVLSGVYRSLGQGFEWPDVVQARTLLCSRA